MKSFSFSLIGFVAASLLSMIFFSACSSKPKNLAADCKISYDKYHTKFEKGKYAAAKEGYDLFVTECAGTEFSEEAYFELAESHFYLKEWMEAEQEYESFLKEYPSSRRFSEPAHYRMAISRSRQTQPSTRDQSKTLEAIREFESYVAEFSESPRVDSAKAELEILRGLLADRDSRIARLYSRMDEPLAAAIYYKHILKEYGDRVPRREITLKLAECYIKLEQFVEAETQLAQFDGIAKDDPFRENVKAAQHKLQVAQAKYEKKRAQEKKEDKEAKQADSTAKAM